MLLVQERFYGREVILADRDMVEQNSGLSDHSMHSISVWKVVMESFIILLLSLSLINKFLQMRSCRVLISVMWHFWLLVIL